MSEELSLEDLGSPTNWLLVSEIFESHQGEGPSAGQVAGFLRLGACNLHCRWCDTPYTWVYTERQQQEHRDSKIYNPKLELRRMSFISIIQQLNELDSSITQWHPLVVISGGEPMLQAERVAGLIRLINSSLIFHRFEIETAGTISPGPLMRFDNVSFNVSLKLASSGNELAKRYNPDVIQQFVNSVSNFKFVITSDNFVDDIAEVQSIVRCFHILPDKVWLMPEGTTALDQISGVQRLMPRALKLGYNVTTRLHILGYGDKRGI